MLLTTIVKNLGLYVTMIVLVQINFGKIKRVYLLQTITPVPTAWPSSDLRLSVGKQLRNT
jgi:hypothetical protein